MQHFKLIFAIQILGLVCSIPLAIALVVTFVLNYLYLEPELKEAANFDRWGCLLLISTGVCVGLALITAYSSSVLSRFLSGKRNNVVGEMIYILGIAQEETLEQRKIHIGSVYALPEVPQDDDVSLYGFGLSEDTGLWTFFGRKPTPRRAIAAEEGDGSKPVREADGLGSLASAGDRPKSGGAAVNQSSAALTK